MIIKDVTPIMTSNTTPEPYKVSSSSIHPVNYAWKAFNGTNVDQYDCWRTEYCSSAWIAIDLGSSVAISGVEFTSTDYLTNYPFERFEVYGSMDGEEWELMISIYGGSSPDRNTKESFSFGKMFSYRHYKINIPETFDNYVAISKINFICDYRLRDQKLSFYKTLSENLPEFIESLGNEVHFTEKGGIFINDSYGKLIKCGGSGTGTSIDFADKLDIDSLLEETGFLEVADPPSETTN